MKISNETKVGALTAIAITLLILGFNFLKGTSLTTNKLQYYAKFDNIQGLTSGNPVLINGKQVGSIYETDGGKDMREITVIMNMNTELNIPNNSVAIITPSILGTTSLEIRLGNSTANYKNKDTISTSASPGMFDEALEKIDPVLYQVKNAVKSLDSLLDAVNSILDAQTKSNLKKTFEHLSTTTSNLSAASSSMQTLLNTQNGVIYKTMENLNSVTGNLKENNENISKIMTNLESTTGNLSKLDFEKTLTTLNSTVADLKNTIATINSDKGTLGKLLHDQTLYNNLTATSNKANLLLDDLRLHPKRYVSISVFGKKDKSDPLTVPLPDTINAPYTSPKAPAD